MVWTDKFTEMVVGRGLADQLDKARLEKLYQGAEQTLKQTTHVACEPRLEAPKYKDKNYMLQRTESLSVRCPQEGTIRPSRPKIQRSQSEIVTATPPTFTTPCDPPDISAIDLSNDAIHTAYSQTDNRSRRLTPMPPLEQMTGFGKYRRSVHADSEWQLQQYRKNLRDFPGLVSQLGEFKLADPDPAVWDQFCQESARSNSFASSNTSHSNSSEGPNDYSTDRRAGPVITRGFVASTTSSATSSFRENSSGHVRNDSGQSVISTSGETENKLIRFHSRPSTLSLLCEPTALSAITEDWPRDNPRVKKMSQILKYGIEGDTENAVESDYEDDEDDDAEDENFPMHLDGARNCHTGKRPPSRLTVVQPIKLPEKMVFERARGHDLSQNKPRCAKSGLNRSTTVIRKPVKPGLCRTVSRSKQPLSKRMITPEKHPTLCKKPSPARPQPSELTSYALISSEESTEAHENLGDLGLYMAGTKNSTASRRKERDDLVRSFESDSTMHAVNTEVTSKPPTKPRRNRSATAIRIVSQTTEL